MIRFRCPHCQAALSAPDHAAGATVACKSCRKPMRVPVPVADADPGEEAPESSRVGAFLLALLLLAGLGVGGFFVFRQIQQGGLGAVGSAPQDAEKAAFLKIVRENADDPGDLEIVTWGQRTGTDRPVTFRCRRVGVHRIGRQKRPAGPIMLEQAVISYDGERVASVSCDWTFQIWHAR